MVYGQQEVVKDLIAARRATGQPPYFEVDAVEPDPERTTICFRHEGALLPALGRARGRLQARPGGLPDARRGCSASSRPR